MRVAIRRKISIVRKMVIDSAIANGKKRARYTSHVSLSLREGLPLEAYASGTLRRIARGRRIDRTRGRRKRMSPAEKKMARGGGGGEERERIKHSRAARYRWIMHNRGNGPLRRFKSHKCIARLFPRTRTVLSGHSPSSPSLRIRDSSPFDTGREEKSLAYSGRKKGKS